MTRALCSSFFAGGLLLFTALGCSRFINSYHCKVEGEPEPRTAGEYDRRGVKHLEAGELDCALGACNEAIRLEPKNAGGYRCRGSVYQAKHDYERALADFNEALKLLPNEPAFYVKRALLYQVKGDFDLAIADFNRAIQLAPNDGSMLSPEVYSLRGQAYAEHRDFDRAIADFDEAIRRKPDYDWYYDHRGQAYYEKGDYRRALSDFEEALKRADATDKPYFSADRDKAQARLNSEGPTTNKPTAARAPISGGVLNGKAISLPQPTYPEIAKAAKASGTVIVEVLIDEDGNVLSAHAVSGHPLLQASAIAAAKQAKFAPTRLSGELVKVNGTLIYNFAQQ